MKTGQRASSLDHEDTTWSERAACRKIAPALLNAWFFPADPTADTKANAKAVCDECPVFEECLTWATRTGYGKDQWSRSFVAAGGNYRERRLMRAELTKEQA